MTNEQTTAWDCATGNGQIAKELARFFDKVFATDISEQQILNAVKKNNIFYSISRAEESPFENNSFDLITVGQAIHWFNFDLFYKEVLRTIKKGGVLAVVGYGLLKLEGTADEVLNHFYKDVVGRFWDEERKYVDEKYTTIPFPFEEIKAPEFCIEYCWTKSNFLGYLSTWSAVQHCKKSTGKNPVDIIMQNLENVWTDQDTRTVIFPVLLRVARL